MSQGGDQLHWTCWAFQWRLKSFCHCTSFSWGQRGLAEAGSLCAWVSHSWGRNAPVLGYVQWFLDHTWLWAAGIGPWLTQGTPESCLSRLWNWHSFESNNCIWTDNSPTGMVWPLSCHHKGQHLHKVGNTMSFCAFLGLGWWLIKTAFSSLIMLYCPTALLLRIDSGKMSAITPTCHERVKEGRNVVSLTSLYI